MLNYRSQSEEPLPVFITCRLCDYLAIQNGKPLCTKMAQIVTAGHTVTRREPNVVRDKNCGEIYCDGCEFAKDVNEMKELTQQAHDLHDELVKWRAYA